MFEAFLDTREKRREYARRKIAEGKIRGHLAYAGGKVVGWCNANEKSKCYECFCWSRFMKEISREDPSEKVMAVFCFAVSPEYRGMGIASALLSRVCEDAKEEGYSFVEAYPNAKFEDQAKDYMGPIGMYRKAGFSVKYSASGKKVVRKCVHREDK